MLTLRKGNLLALSEALQRAIGARLVKYTMARFPHVFGKDEAAARSVVEKACAAAAMYSITSDEDVAVFVDLSVMYGEDFHRDPWAAEVLAESSLTPKEKMIELQDRVYESGALM